VTSDNYCGVYLKKGSRVLKGVKKIIEEVD
jgi:hypothetical protein